MDINVGLTEHGAYPIAIFFGRLMINYWILGYLLRVQLRLLGSSNNSHPVTLTAKKLAFLLSPHSMSLHCFAWKGLQKFTAISVRMPACIGQQH